MRLMVYTDGSAHAKDRTGGWAFLLTDASKTKWLRVQYAHDPATTNNRMELKAVIEGLRHSLSIHIITEVIVYTDSQYVKQVYDFNLLETWKYLDWTTTAGTPVKNQDLWEELELVFKEYKAKKVPVRFKKVKAHSGDAQNEYVDKMAGKARTEKKSGYAQLAVV